MSNRNWRFFAALAGLALVYPIDERANAQGRTSEDQNETAQEARPASPIAIEDSLARIARAVEAAQSNSNTERAEQRADSDLQAQQDMALWARWMFIATAMTVLVTILGVFLVWRTLVHTRRASRYTGVAARQARRATIATEQMLVEAGKSREAAILAVETGQEANLIAREARRPWLGLKVVLAEVALASEEPVRYGFDYEVYMENTGQVAALDVSLHIAAGFMADLERIKSMVMARMEVDDRDRDLRSVLPGEKELSPSRVAWQKDKMFISHGSDDGERFVPAIAVGCCYSGPERTERFKTFRIFVMHIDGVNRRDKCTYMTDLPATKYVAIPRGYSIAT